MRRRINLTPALRKFGFYSFEFWLEKFEAKDTLAVMALAYALNKAGVKVEDMDVNEILVVLRDIKPIFTFKRRIVQFL